MWCVWLCNLFYFSNIIDKNCVFVVYFFYAHELFFKEVLLFINF